MIEDERVAQSLWSLNMMMESQTELLNCEPQIVIWTRSGQGLLVTQNNIKLVDFERAIDTLETAKKSLEHRPTDEPTK